MEPVMLRHVALRDGDEAGETRFRCQQVVERVVELRRVRRHPPGDSRSRRCACGGRRESRTASRRPARGRRASACAAVGGTSPVRSMPATASATARRQYATRRRCRARRLGSSGERCELGRQRLQTGARLRTRRAATRCTIAMAPAALTVATVVSAPLGNVGRRCAGEQRRRVGEAGQAAARASAAVRNARAVRARAPSARRPDCRCRPSTRSADAAARASSVSYQLRK